ncbi:MAG: metallophosphoesterase [Candidatus Obscuribacterales bacterium]|nr:metallophosphoesterase [Candidatus Obscuribacterales bacterium]
MTSEIDRREFLKLAGIGGVVFMSGIHGLPGIAMPGNKDFYFVQLSDSHWGFEGAKINPDAKGTLIKAVKEVNALNQKPDFVVFTGDLTQTTDDTNIRKARMKEFKEIVGELNTKVVHFMPGEHDASIDKGETYKEFFGDTHYTFEHKGVHFIAIDNVSDPTGSIGTEQLEWLKNSLATIKPDADIVVLTHRPLFDLYPQWDWATRDGAKAIELLMPFKNVSVFYGHIHQEHHHMTGHIAHHSATSLMLPMPVAGSTPKRMPIPWNSDEPYKGMGFRNVLSETKIKKFELNQYPINEAAKV